MKNKTSCFTLSINLGNAAMQTPQDVANTMAALAIKIESLSPSGVAVDSGIIRDTNGNVVGEWAYRP